MFKGRLDDPPFPGLTDVTRTDMLAKPKTLAGDCAPRSGVETVLRGQQAILIHSSNKSGFFKRLLRGVGVLFS